MSVITSCQLSRLRVPLTTPYKLSLGEIVAFDTILVELSDDAGNQGLGEATIVTGYTDETVEQSWQAAVSVAESFIDCDVATVLSEADKLFAQTPFISSAITSSVEMLKGYACLTSDVDRRIPLLALVYSEGEEALRDEINRYAEQGYKTLKVKVGFSVNDDINRVRTIQNLLPDDIQIRIDANQGFNEADAKRFVTEVEPHGIELLEQPCAANDWQAHEAVARISRLPLMLDESIYGVEDIKRAADGRCASFIKLKLMKMGGLEKLRAGLNMIKSLGMTPVLGNGVACAPGCWQELCVASELIDNAGEMNGFLKPRDEILLNPVKVQNAHAVVPANYRPELDQNKVKQLSVEQKEFFI